MKMEERLEKLANDFKTGIFYWVIAYLVYYVYAKTINNIGIYNKQILTLINGDDLFHQAAMSGFSYVILKAAVKEFCNRLGKIESGTVKDCVKNIVTGLLIVAVAGAFLEVADISGLVGEDIYSIMVFIVIIEGMTYGMKQAVNTSVYNKKLKEKQKENN